MLRLDAPDGHIAVHSPAEILTAVVRVPDDVGGRLLRVLEPVRRAHPTHYYYPLESLHLTVQSFRGLSERSPAFRAAVDRLGSAVTASKPPTITLRGIALASVSIVTWATADGWQFDRAWRAGTSPPGSESRTLPPHVNLVRLAESPKANLRRILAGMGAIDLGAFAPDEVVVVRCNAVMAPESLEILQHLAFRRRSARHRP